MNKFLEAIRPTPEEAEATATIDQAYQRGLERAAEGHNSLGAGTQHLRLEQLAREKGLCLHFHQRLIRAVSTIMTSGKDTVKAETASTH